MKFEWATEKGNKVTLDVEGTDVKSFSIEGVKGIQFPALQKDSVEFVVGNRQAKVFLSSDVKLALEGVISDHMSKVLKNIENEATIDKEIDNFNRMMDQE